MEHLILPKHRSVKHPIEIPYKCKVPYDADDFLAYPARANLHWAVTVEQMLDSVLFPKSASQVDQSDLEAALQTWLYFGLIAEFLGEYISRDQLRRQSDESGIQILCSAGLPAAVDTWVSDMKARNESSEVGYVRKLDCLNLLLANIRCLKPYMTEDLLLLLASLGELFSVALQEVYQDVDLVRRVGKPSIIWRHFIDLSFWSRLMQANDFCPSQQKVTLEASIRIHSLWYIVHLAQPKQPHGHKHCDEHVCHAQQKNAGSSSHYRTLHISDECCCEFLEAPGAAEILWSGYLPLLQITPGSSLAELRLDLQSSRDYPKYVALSHVWADGLGNWQANALPKCQLLSLYKMVTELESSLQLSEGEHVLLWCDTICCPVEPITKNLALAEMRRTYQEASAVLALDSSLRQFDRLDINYGELVFRILTGGWSRRLWTLQEAMLGTAGARLWFQCRDKAVNIKSILDFILEEWRGVASRKCLAADLMIRTGDWFTFFDGNDNNVTDLRLLSESLESRSVSVSADEPLLLANLLKLDSAKILEAQSVSSRMQILWTQVTEAKNGIPSSLIFRIGLRMQLPGFRWAPSTLLGSHKDNFPLNMYQTVDGKCEITPHGLRLKFPGYVFNLASRTGLLRTVGRELMAKPEFDLIYARRPDGSWVSLTSMIADSKQRHTYLTSPSFSSAIFEANGRLIIARQRDYSSNNHIGASERTFRALLAKETAKNGDVRIVRSLFHVGVHRANASLSRLLDAALTATEKLLDMPTAQLLGNDDHWILAKDVEDARVKMATLQTEVEELVGKFDKDDMEYVANSDGRMGVVKQVYHFVLGMYGILSEEIPETQEWCVD